MTPRSNILITKSGQAKLSDFGVSSLLNDLEKRFSVVGTPYWSTVLLFDLLFYLMMMMIFFFIAVPPEVIDLKGWHPAGDVWSLGCTIIEMLTGVPPHFSYYNYYHLLLSFVSFKLSSLSFQMSAHGSNVQNRGGADAAAAGGGLTRTARFLEALFHERLYHSSLRRQAPPTPVAISQQGLCACFLFLLLYHVSLFF